MADSTPAGSSSGGAAAGLASPMTSAAVYTATDLGSVTKFWAQFDLDGQRHKFNQQATAMLAAQEETTVNRKALIELNRAYKAAPVGDGRQKALEPLLKAMQDEIDRLTLRAKNAERAFKDLYRPLAVAPDPAVVLSEAAANLSRLHSSDAHVARLKDELAQYQQEFASLKNQDITLRQLEEQITQIQANMDAKITERVRERESELQAVLSSELAALRVKERDAAAAVTAAHDECASIQQALEAAQSSVLEERKRHEEELAGVRAELDSAMEETERASARAMKLGSDNEHLRAALARAGAAEGHEHGQAVSEATTRLLEAEAELAKQMAAYRQLSAQWETTMAQRQKDHDETVGTLQEQLNASQQTIAELQQQLESRPPQQIVDNLRAQVALLESVHFHVEETDGDVAAIGGTMDANKAVIRRVRQLEDTVVKLQRQVSDQAGALQSTNQELAVAQDAVHQRDALVRRLEADLAARTAAGGSHSQADHLQRVLGGSQSPTAVSLDAEPQEESGVSVVGILRAQRDRFKVRVQELEGELAAVKAAVAAAEAKAAKVTRDNVKLVEKVRFLESYGGAGNRPEGNAAQEDGGTGSLDRVETGGTGSLAGGADGSGGHDFERPYARMYEDTVNPFTVFNRREKQRRYTNLSAPERITLSSTQFFLSHRWARNFVFFYSLALHLLVFATLYHFTHASHERCDK